MKTQPAMHTAAMDTVELRRADLPLVFAVVREEFPRLELDQWLAFGAAYVDRDRLGDTRGIVAARTALNRYRGLFLFVVETTLDHGPTLTLPHVIVPQIPDRAQILESFVGAALDLARRHACQALRSTVPAVAAKDVLGLLGPRAQVSGLSLCVPVVPSDRLKVGSA